MFAVVLISAAAISAQTTRKIYREAPQFVGGELALIEFINENMVYPEKALADSVQGKVVVSFKIKKNGKIKDVKVTRKLRKDLDKEAIRLVKMLPDFIPGKMDGKPIESVYVMPIYFSLEKKEEKPVQPDRLPEFPGGVNEMIKYMTVTLKYPQGAFERGVEGIVETRFMVQKDGKIGEIEILKSVDEELDAEALRLIKSFPDFVPGVLQGENVDAWFTLPISFRLPVKPKPVEPTVK